jgi:hypothetical protein
MGGSPGQHYVKGSFPLTHSFALTGNIPLTHSFPLTGSFPLEGA